MQQTAASTGNLIPRHKFLVEGVFDGAYLWIRVCFEFSNWRDCTRNSVGVQEAGAEPIIYCPSFSLFCNLILPLSGANTQRCHLSKQTHWIPMRIKKLFFPLYRRRYSIIRFHPVQVLKWSDRKNVKCLALCWITSIRWEKRLLDYCSGYAAIGSYYSWLFRCRHFYSSDIIGSCQSRCDGCWRAKIIQKPAN